jgi:tetratricopeptide (TPR) repeat protein
MRNLRFASFLLAIACASPAAAFQAAAAPRQTGCTVQHFLANDANVALAERKFGKASDLFLMQLEKYPDSTAARVGLVRAELGAGKLDEALKLATEYAAAAPDDALIADVLGETRFRRGEIAEAAAALNKSMHADPCQGRVHYDIARYQTLAGNFLTAQKQIDLAHRLAPDDADITRYYERLHAQPPTAEETIARLTRRLNREGISPVEKQEVENRIRQVQAHGNGSCEIADPAPTAKITLFPVLHEYNNAFSSVALEVELNGVKRRLLVDTGASGLLLTRAAAEKAGLTPEASTRIGGVGDQGDKRGFIAHVDKLRVGGMEFHQCEVEVIDSKGEAPGDGLIGADVFGRWLVTLDIPMRELRLAPLPKRPGDEAAAEKPLRLETNGAEGARADTVDPHDRYIAPEMEDWSRVYRYEHDIIFPTRVNDMEAKLFLMDSGAFSGTLAPAVAKQIGNLVPVDTVIRGLSGDVQQVFTVDKQVTLDFGHVKQLVRGISVIDLGGVSRGQGFELTGIIGFSTLRELIVSIDYRDNLVKVVFDPKHGFHSNGRMEY